MKQKSPIFRSGFCFEEFYGQAERAISSSKLNRLPGLRICPIQLVVFQCPCYPSVGRSHLGEGSRLYAFSGYLDRTSLPSDAAGATTGSTRGSSGAPFGSAPLDRIGAAVTRRPLPHHRAYHFIREVVYLEPPHAHSTVPADRGSRACCSAEASCPYSQPRWMRASRIGKPGKAI